MQITGRPRPPFRERHFDYAMRPDEFAALKTITAGQKITIPFNFDTDAPFILRSRALRVPYTVACGGTPAPTSVLTGLRLRYSDATKEYRQQDTIRQTTEMAYYGQWGLPLPVYPGIPFPPGGTMLVDIFNDGSTTISNLTLYWRGVKLFPWGQRFDYTYPKKFRSTPYSYSLVTPNDDTNPLGLLLNVPIKTSGALNSQVFKLQDDADFVIRSGQAGAPASSAIFEIFFKLYDADHYPYSNFPIHFDVLFGNFTTQAIFTYGGGSATAPYGGGPYAPGLFYPEIYLPKSHIMYYDVTRDDSAIACAAVSNYPVVLNGSKVFPQ